MSRGREWAARLGPTTEAVTLTTGQRIRFTLEALQQNVDRFPGTFLPQTVEHLHYLPPIGLTTRMWLQPRGNDHDLMASGRELRRGSAPPDLAAAQAGCSSESSDELVELNIGFEPRNFEPTDVEEFIAACPIECRRTAMHADLPPLIWMLAGGAGTVALSQMKTYLQAVTKSVAEDHGRRLVEWLGGASRKARQASRLNLLEFAFDVDRGFKVLAFCPFSPATAGSFDELRHGLERLVDLDGAIRIVDAQSAGEGAKMVAFYWCDGSWHLAWWCSDVATHVTDWFRRNAPSPRALLGRDLLVGRAEVALHMGRSDADAEPQDTRQLGD